MMMRIALLHNHYDKAHLKTVKEQMKILGAPNIHAVWMECYGHWAALEGCHRIRAAYELGLTPNIIEVEYSDDMISSIFGELEDDYPISEICDDSYKSTIIEFEEEEV